ncbi:MAG TPA: cation transporter, partial [Sporichthya sp.]|nr:cation transporter [Sporichthya sp.]
MSPHRPDRSHEHAHEHAHGHGHGHHEPHDHAHADTGWPRVAHVVSEVFRGHSHDPLDQVDAALDGDTEGRRALTISLGILAATAAFQGAVALASGSVALLGDSLHNVADALTAVPLLIAFRLARKPANTRYTYGYGRAEDLAGLFVIAMIALS